MNNIILDELELNFNNIEKEVYGIICEAGLSRIKLILENVDNMIFENRDTKRYRYKFKTEKTIQTIMGDLTFNRTYYIDRYNNRGVFLLYFSGYEKGSNFDNLINSHISEVYNQDKIRYTILNGDGAPWISAETENDIQKIYQLDLFHIFQKANRKIEDEESRNAVKKLLKEKKYGEVRVL